MNVAQAREAASRPESHSTPVLEHARFVLSRYGATSDLAAMEAAGRVLDSRTSIRVGLSPDDEVVITTTVEQHMTIGKRTTPAKVSVLRSRIRGVYASETPEAVRDLLVMSRLCPYFTVGSWVVGDAEKTVVSDEVRQPWTVGEAIGADRRQ